MNVRIVLSAVLAMVTICAVAPANECSLGPDDSPIDRHAIDRNHVGDYDERQGGENYDTAIVIQSLPIVLNGTTCGYTNDCSDFCGPWGTEGPDVVYAFTATSDTSIAIDTCGSLLNTTVFVRDEWLNIVACNDDRWEPSGGECDPHTSWIVRAPVLAGATYYIVVAGTHYQCDEYVISVEYFAPCNLYCSGVPEGEPPLHDGYVDEFNRGCNGGNNFQELNGNENGDQVFCGTSGYYEAPSGSRDGDLDWFVVTLGPSGTLEWNLEADQYTVGHVAYPTDCDSYQFVATLEAGVCGSGSLIYEGNPGESVWLVVTPYFLSRPQNFVGHEYDYICRISGLQPGTVAIEQRTWGSVKGMFTP